jgi:uncharacterized protein with NAD-binding domain and iron-sulfur cluster
VPLSECAYYVRAHLPPLFQPPERLREELSGLSYEQYLRMDQRSPQFRKYFGGLPQMITAAREDADAFPIVKMMAAMLFSTSRRIESLKHLPRGCVMMMNGPTSERMIEPWRTYLQAIGVNICTSTRVKSLSFQNGRVRSIQVFGGDEVPCDYAVLALPYIGLKWLCAHAHLGESLPHLLAPHRLRLESSSGLQFYLKGLPEPTPLHFRPGVPTTHLESPWALATVVQGQGFWNDVSLPPDTRYILSATISCFDRPGPLTGKPASHCSPEEIRDEVLAQSGFPPQLVSDWHMFRDLVRVSETEYQAARDSLPPHLAFDSVDGYRLINFAPLSVHLPGAEDAVPKIRTEISNLFLAGEATWDPDLAFQIASMEKAANTGYLAARYLLMQEHPAFAQTMSIPQLEELPFGGFVRS